MEPHAALRANAKYKLGVRKSSPPPPAGPIGEAAHGRARTRTDAHGRARTRTERFWSQRKILADPLRILAIRPIIIESMQIC